MNNTSCFVDLKIHSNYFLNKHNSLKVGGAADFFCQPKNQQHIIYAFNWAKKKNIPITFLGQGTNVLISDHGVEGLVIGLQKLNTYNIDIKNDRLNIAALAGATKANIMQIFMKYKLAPALFLCGLPGDIGGGIVMNAGIGKLTQTYPTEFKDIVDWVKVIREQKIILIKSTQIKWSYRLSEGWQPGIIYEVGMSWPLKPILPNVAMLLRELALKRTNSQPLQSATCGSVFKNPPSIGKTSGAMIEQCGLKGYRIGQASVSTKHANFIINLGEAKATDIHNLIEHVKKTVQNKFNIILKPEVKYIGRWT